MLVKLLSLHGPLFPCRHTSLLYVRCAPSSFQPHTVPNPGTPPPSPPPTGIPQPVFRPGPAAAATAAPSHPPPAVPMPVARGGGSGPHTLVRSPSAPSGLAPGFSRRSAADLFSELRLCDPACPPAAGSAQHAPSVPGMALRSVPSVPSMAALGDGGLAAQAPHVSSLTYSGPCLTPCCDQASFAVLIGRGQWA